MVGDFKHSQFRDTTRTLARRNRSSGIMSNIWQNNDCYRSKHKVRFKKLKNQKSKLQVQNVRFSGDLALENIVSLKDPGYNGEKKKLPSPLSGGPHCKLVLQSGAGPLRDSMVGDFKHSRKYETIIILSKKKIWAGG